MSFALMLGVALGESFYEISAGVSRAYTWDIYEGVWSRNFLPFFSFAVGGESGRDALAVGIEIHPFTMKESFRDGELRYPDGRVETTDEDYKSTYLLLASYRWNMRRKFYAKGYLGLSWVSVYGVIKRYKDGLPLGVHEYRTGEWGISAGGGLGVLVGRRKRVSFYGEIFAVDTEILSFGEMGFPQWFLGLKLNAEF